MLIQSRPAIALACAACASLATAPGVVAAELPSTSGIFSAPFAANNIAQWDSNAVTVARSRHHDHRDDYGRRYDYDDDFDADDLLTGILIVGGIALLANAIANSSKESKRREESNRYPERDDAGRYSVASGLDYAAQQCVSEIERNRRVDRVDSVNRDGLGWRVAGRLFNGEGFVCQIDNEGRISNISFANGHSAQPNRAGPINAGPVIDRQWSSERYAQAWRDVDASRELARNGTPHPGFRAGSQTTGNTPSLTQQSVAMAEPEPDSAVFQSASEFAPRPSERQPANAAHAANDQLPDYPGGPIDGDLMYEGRPAQQGG